MIFSVKYAVERFAGIFIFKIGFGFAYRLPLCAREVNIRAENKVSARHILTVVYTVSQKCKLLRTFDNIRAFTDAVTRKFLCFKSRPVTRFVLGRFFVRGVKAARCRSVREIESREIFRIDKCL